MLMILVYKYDYKYLKQLHFLKCKVKFQVKVDENGKIIEAKFKTFGCGSAIASSSLATEWVKGKNVSCFFYIILLEYVTNHSFTFHVQFSI